MKTNRDSSLSDGESQEDPEFRKGGIKQFDVIDVGLKMSSYTVGGLAPGVDYLFELCLRKENFVIVINSAVFKTKDEGYEVGLGIQTDWVTLLAVALVLTVIVVTCIFLGMIRWWRFHTYRLRSKDKDTSSQKEMISSPSDHSSVGASAVLGPPESPEPGSTTGDESRLVDHEVTSPVDEIQHEIA